MDAANKPKTPDMNLENVLDVFCQEFDGISFYGLEYIVDELFQTKRKKPPVSPRSSDEWFDFYD
ncbi:MAG: hypothetical protein ACU84H_06210 [Gammaproteobacteria bacterium]